MREGYSVKLLLYILRVWNRNKRGIGKTRTDRISKQGSPWLRWILVQCAMTAVRYDQHLKSFYERLKSRKGSAKAIVATAKEILVIIWYMLTRRELYRNMNKERYEQKLSRIKNIKESVV
ncbi:MAG: transposase [Candidatus Nitrosopolaris sp.]